MKVFPCTELLAKIRVLRSRRYTRVHKNERTIGTGQVKQIVKSPLRITNSLAYNDCLFLNTLETVKACYIICILFLPRWQFTKGKYTLSAYCHLYSVVLFEPRLSRPYEPRVQSLRHMYLYNYLLI